ncbi:MAG: DUF3048 domain-containing protein [Candidatus Kerfeldbacteria bacterium]|nr:DUF3048 domain-containing protein [Candidatus Kerfeldbacteria bacterium]
MPEQKQKLKKSQPEEKSVQKKEQSPWPMKQRPWMVAVGIFIGATIGVWWLFGVQIADAWQYVREWSGIGITTTLGIGEAADTNDDGDAGLVPRLLDGVLVESAQSNLVPYSIMIENLLSVRPQSGLSAASVVYETLVEGGATRFMAVFDPRTSVPTIMPVRSSRAYFLEWALEYDVLYGHAGGSPHALQVIREQGVRDFDALTSRGAKYYWRDSNRPAPHNLVTSSEKMVSALDTLELDLQHAEFLPWKFKDGALPADRGADGKTLTFNFSYGTTYEVDFTYNQERNQYLRFNANQPHVDANTNEQIAVDNVIVQLVEEPVLNGGKGRIDMFVGGTGDAWVARDGQMIKATWRKDANRERTRFYDESGAEIELNRGTTWVHVVTKTQGVTYE